MDWPINIVESLAIRDVLRGRARRAEEAADALASAHRDPPAAWHARVLASIADLRQSWRRDAAQRLVQAWDDGRPHWAPPATVALAPWAMPLRDAVVWDPEEIRRVSSRLRDHQDLAVSRAAYLADRWSRQRNREWHAAATAWLRWAQQRAAARQDSARSMAPIGILLLLAGLLWARRRA